MQSTRGQREQRGTRGYKVPALLAWNHWVDIAHTLGQSPGEVPASRTHPCPHLQRLLKVEGGIKGEGERTVYISGRLPSETRQVTPRVLPLQELWQQLFNDTEPCLQNLHLTVKSDFLMQHWLLVWCGKYHSKTTTEMLNFSFIGSYFTFQ